MQKHLHRLVLIGSVGMTLCAILPRPASAEGFFDFFFGGPRRSAPAPQQSYQPSSNSYAEPSGTFDEDRPARRSEGGTYASYCVRTCDGRFFPLPKNAGTTPAQTCNSFCPASHTKVYSGNGIANAITPEGKRYDDLDNAFVYRQKIVADCTCNGHDALGLAHVDVRTDPTLRAGDIVATRQGLMAYSRGKNETAAFTPISGEMQKKLATVKIAPFPNAAEDEAADMNLIAPRADNTPSRPDRRRASTR